MLDRRYDHHFVAVKRGDTTFEEFVEATAPLWKRIARQIHKRWMMPHWHTQEETVQNLLLAAWMFLWDYDPEKAKGRSLQQFVVWNAFDKAKKAAHVARSARRSGNADAERGHFDRYLSSYATQPGEGPEDDSVHDVIMFGLGAYTEADQESTLIEREEAKERGARAWSWADSFTEMRALEALSEAGSVGEAAKRIWEDVEIRLELNLEAPEDAARVVRRATRAVAKRMSTAA